MRRFLFALTLSLAVAGLIAAATTSSVAAAPASSEITSYVVTPGGTWADPATQLMHRYYSVTINFSHRGLMEARVTEKDAEMAGIDSDHAWFRGSGTEAFTGSVVGGLVGQPVYFELLLYKYGPHHTLQVVDSMTIGAYTS